MSEISAHIKAYRDTGDVSSELEKLCATNELHLEATLYRGDCCYSSFIQIGKFLHFNNRVSSWTSNKEIAYRFANVRNAPEWYLDESEWNMSYAYPYSEAIENDENLHSVIFVYRGDAIHGLVTSHYINPKEDKEFVSIDEHEIIVGDTCFIITGIDYPTHLDEPIFVILERYTGQTVTSEWLETHNKNEEALNCRGNQRDMFSEMMY